MHVEEQHSQSIALRLVKQGEEIGSMYQDEGGDGVQLIQKRHRDCDQNQSQHAQGVPVVDRHVNLRGDRDR